MSISLTSPVTGATETGLTSPTYTNVVDQPPDVNAKQNYVTALGGTQTGVRVHSAADPFTVSFWRDKVIKTLGQLGLNGQYADVPVNKYKVITRKGVIVALNQPPRVMIIRTEIEVPAGAETYDSANVRAAQSFHIGSLNQQSAGLGDTIAAGSL
jgi:hypothetical protein